MQQAKVLRREPLGLQLGQHLFFHASKLLLQLAALLLQAAFLTQSLDQLAILPPEILVLERSLAVAKPFLRFRHTDLPTSFVPQQTGRGLCI